MKVVEGATSLRRELDAARCRGEKVGFVPTMGYFHEGHLSLVRRAREENDVVVVSIFVNPLQFGPSEDLDTYPRDLPRDLKLCEGEKVDLVFAPSEEEMYPTGESKVSVSAGRFGEIVEGEHRPGHFDGVATVCTKLFSIVGACRAYFGEKDAQQLALIRRLASDLSMPVEVVGCRTVRGPDGVALSSRNTYLSPEEREAARVLSKALFEAEEAIRGGEGSAEKIKEAVSRRVAGESRIDLQYVEVVDPQTFETVAQIEDDVVVALAAFAGGTRLIDNVWVTGTHAARIRR